MSVLPRGVEDFVALVSVLKATFTIFLSKFIREATEHFVFKLLLSFWLVEGEVRLLQLGQGKTGLASRMVSNVIHTVHAETHLFLVTK